MNLVVQGPALDSADLEAIALLAKPRLVRSTAPRVFRLADALKNEGIAALCEARRIDHAWMPAGARLAGLKLLAMDMDSTLITIECIDELGALAGKGTEISAITAAAMRGEIADYQESLRRRVALLKGQPEKILDEVYVRKLKLTPGAEILLQTCKDNGVKTLLVSGGFTFFTERLKARLGLDYTLSNTLEVKGGRLTGNLLGGVVDADAKAARFIAVLREIGAEKSESMAIGDGANDLKMMAEAGLSVAFHAKPVVRAQASCAITWCGLDAVVNLFE